MCTRYGESWCPLSMPKGMWGAFLPYGSPNGAYNTVGTNVSAYNTVCVRLVVEHCSPLVPSERESSVGRLQSVLAMPVGEER